MAKITPEDVKWAKGLGFLRDKRTEDRFNARVVTRNGKITAAEARAVADAAERFGNGEITMTSRLGMEIQSVPFENIEPLCACLAEIGLETGGTGPRVRPVASCKGTTCVYGLIDTFALSEEIHRRFYKGYHEVGLPHKFKIGVGGCPNNCIKPDLNDVGIVGQCILSRDVSLCQSCPTCQIEKSCPIHAARTEGGKLSVDEEACNRCGRCVGNCPYGVVRKISAGYRIFLGGRWGKKGERGRPMDKIFTDAEEVLNVVEKAILLFYTCGKSGERFGDTIRRMGFDKVQEMLLSDELLSKRPESVTQQKLP